MIQDYRSGGSAGSLRFLAVLWWDQTAQVYRLLTCANNDGCSLRGTVIWEGKKLVNSWEQTVDGKTARFQDSFVDVLSSRSPANFECRRWSTYASYCTLSRREPPNHGPKDCSVSTRRKR